MPTFNSHLSNQELPYPVPHLSPIDWSEAQKRLYQRIMEFDIDGEPVDFTFAHRLALENGWTMAYTRRVIREYKHFIFLAVCAHHPVTPSDQVDQAWHLHLRYTQSYWGRLCQEVLGRPLHHIPTRVSPAKARNFVSGYSYTLKSYQRLFGMLPPVYIWPNVESRFSDCLVFHRVNSRRQWIIHKPSSTIRFLLLIVGLTALVFCGALIPNQFADHLMPIAGMIVLIVIVLKENRCAACDRFNTMVKTGVVQIRSNNEPWEERRCQYCDYCEWNKCKHASGGGGGGGWSEGGGGGGLCGG